MSEKSIQRIEKQDIQAPDIQPGGTAIVLQRHEKYERDRTSEVAGSLLPEAAESAKERDLDFFNEIIAHELGGVETMVLFVSSDTQYADKGRRSLETAQLAQDAAIEAFTAAGIDPSERIINLNDAYMTDRHVPTDQDVRPVRQLREPQIFDVPEYVNHLRDMYGAEDGAGTGISQAAWAAHEADLEKDIREELGVEGVHDILERTKKAVALLARYSKLFHSTNPDKRLIIWATSHYDTISPLVKDATGTPFDEYVPVDYGAGVVMNIAPDSTEIELKAQSQKIPLNLGRSALK